MVQPSKLFGRLGNSLFQYSYIYAQFRRGVLPDIFLQDPKYFEDYEKEIKELFGQDISFLPYVSIHVRRGVNPVNPDEPKYSENPFYVNLSETDYYERAIAMFPVDKFLVFSDDIEYCKSKWGNNPRFSIIEGQTEIEDLNMMASCKSNIIANSSFSWWAGFLNPNPAKTVVYPKEWFTDGINRVGFPKTWTKI